MQNVVFHDKLSLRGGGGEEGRGGEERREGEGRGGEKVGFRLS